MARITKLELTQINARLAAENEALRKQVADLSMSLEIVSCAHADAEQDLARVEQRPTRADTQRPARSAYVMPAWQVERAAAMAAAKQAAMAMRCVVKA